VLQVSTRVLGDEHPDTLRSMNNLAVTLTEQGDHARARVLQERVLDVRTRVLGEAHPATLKSMNNLAVLLLEAGDAENSLRLFRECLAGQRKVLGEHHQETVTTAEFLRGLEAQPQAAQPSSQPDPR
jgi:hypothetical protein